MNYKLKIINPETDKRWDEFVFNHQNGIIYHHSLWGKVISETYGYEPFYLTFENEKTHQFEGAIPLMLVNSHLTGKRMVSLPLTSYCPPLVPENELSNIIQFIKKQQSSLDYIEFKYLKKMKNELSNLSEQSLYTTHVLSLNSDLDELLKSFHNSSVRRKIKKAEKNNLKFRISENEEDLKAFYKLEVKVRKKHGLPPQPYSFFKNMWRYLKPKNFMFLPLVEYNDKVVAATIMLKYKDTFYYEYSAADSRFFNLGSNQKLIWETIKIAHQQGAKKFDFGRSSLTNQSLIEFKKRWGTSEQLLHYYYFPNTKRINTDGTDKPLHKFLNFANRHLPLPLLQLEGKLIYHHLG